ncbi:MAG: hypothetical protein KatS3mg091_176 [Patescibacteria group bacterium]|nr:MAG: hypothetical protein KatS3mg091_176 [Patescibacteria group bacterium]
MSVYSQTISGNSIIKAENEGSSAAYNYYIIPDYEKNQVAIFSFPVAFRLRCDFIEDDTKKSECEAYLNSIVQDFGKDEDSKMAYSEGWIQEEYFTKIYSEAELIVKSLSF